MGFTYKWWLLCIIARLRFPCILKQSSLANQLDYDFSIFFFRGGGWGGGTISMGGLFRRVYVYTWGARQETMHEGGLSMECYGVLVTGFCFKEN